MNAKKYISAAKVLLTAVGLAAAITAFAASDAPVKPNAVRQGQMHGRKAEMMRPAVNGTVSAISGTTLTVTGRQSLSATTTATNVFTVDASNAQVMKDNAKAAISNIAVGDEVFIQGTVNGTNVVASMIRDGKMSGPERMKSSGEMPTSTIEGNGQPVVAGTISAISGSTLSITNNSNVVYTIDASNAKIVQGKNTVSLSNIKVGDTVVVQGTINGTSVVASTIITQARPANEIKSQQGIFTKIGQFFMHLFGF